MFYTRNQKILALAIGGMIAFNGIPDAQLQAAFGVQVTAVMRIGVTIVAGGAYALEKLLAKPHGNP